MNKTDYQSEVHLPTIEIQLPEHHSTEETRRVCAAAVEALHAAIPSPPNTFRMRMSDIYSDSTSVKGTSQSVDQNLADARKIVEDYLNAMELRDLETAASHLGDGFTMQFPGARPMRKLQELIDWSRPRYQRVSKTYDRFDVCNGTRETAIVYCSGTLSGEWPDGKKFDGIRFVDRFELVNGKIVQQDVWNDMGEIRGKLEQN